MPVTPPVPPISATAAVPGTGAAACGGRGGGGGGISIAGGGGGGGTGTPIVEARTHDTWGHRLRGIKQRIASDQLTSLQCLGGWRLVLLGLQLVLHDRRPGQHLPI